MLFDKLHSLIFNPGLVLGIVVRVSVTKKIRLFRDLGIAPIRRSQK